MLQLFDFDYIWEVYKPAPQRRWGYYALPIFYRDRFVARIDSRLEKGTWTIANWWWEQDITPDATLLAALARASSRFLHYLHAQEIVVNEIIDSPTRQALLAGARTALVE
ncbi:DNA glycosylase AlkZ-like family protein [Ktedonobacter robiniae]|uniref:Winged helix-turn-helix domain-containing protein n=1 Tax=Ktedonobacter robiniae TaxID=2778365 RepID=A0ABQ3UNA8_9CHLR|nr:hypothetical protein KSB_26400 [Ktedonobacter robiniae]